MTVVWITGAAGFLGRHLARHASRQGARVLGIGHGLMPGDPALGAMSGSVNGDVRLENLDRLRDVAGEPDAIFHLAGGSAVAPSLALPLEDFRRTVEASIQLLDWVRASGQAIPLVCASSAAVYGAGHAIPIAETAEPRPSSPYGFHKLMMELAAQEYARSWGIPSVIVRLFSVYGPGLRKQLLWDIGRRLHAGEPALLLGGTGEERRDWLYVADAVRLLWQAREVAGPDRPVLNGCGGQGVAVEEIATRFCQLWGSEVRPGFSGQSRPGDPQDLVGDPGLAMANGFVATTPLATGLAETVLWMRRELEA